MAKGYKENEQAFGVGDIAKWQNLYVVKIVEVLQGENNNYLYEIRTIEFVKPIVRLVKQKELEMI